MDYVGKICPYCKTAFKEDDDIVVCSICEMPHHKDCWIENKACTTFGCTGTMMGTGENAGKEVEGLVCDKCGHPYSYGQKFCAGCGSVLGESSNATHFTAAGAVQPYQNMQMNYNSNNDFSSYNSGAYTNTNIGFFNEYSQSDTDVSAFLQSNPLYYIEKFNRLALLHTKTSWNWCSFLFGGCWFAYRKMYGIAAGYIGCALAFSMIPSIGVFLNIALWFASGLFGNYMYKSYMDKELTILKSLDQFNKTTYVMQKGGTSTAAAVISVAAIIVGSLLFNSF